MIVWTLQQCIIVAKTTQAHKKKVHTIVAHDHMEENFGHVRVETKGNVRRSDLLHHAVVGVLVEHNHVVKLFADLTLGPLLQFHARVSNQHIHQTLVSHTPGIGSANGLYIRSDTMCTCMTHSTSQGKSHMGIIEMSMVCRAHAIFYSQPVLMLHRHRSTSDELISILQQHAIPLTAGSHTFFLAEAPPLPLDRKSLRFFLESDLPVAPFASFFFGGCMLDCGELLQTIKLHANHMHMTTMTNAAPDEQVHQRLHSRDVPKCGIRARMDG